MADSVSVTYQQTLSAVQTFDTAALPGLATRNVTHSAFNKTGTMTGSTTPPVTNVYSGKPAAGGTIDLTALTNVTGTFSAAGKKVQAVQINNPATNTGALTVSPGAANAYELFGTAKSVVIPVGGSLNMLFNDTLADVDATHKNIDLAGTGAETYEVVIVVG